MTVKGHMGAVLASYLVGIDNSNPRLTDARYSFKARRSTLGV